MQSNRRSTEFEEYLRAQSPERRAALMVAERKFEESHISKLVAAEQFFWEALQGFEDLPAWGARGPG